MHEKYHWLNWRPLQLRILGPGYSGYRAIADTGNRAGDLNLPTPAHQADQWMSPCLDSTFLGNTFAQSHLALSTTIPCIDISTSCLLYPQSPSVSTKQLMSELGCECDRSRSRTGRCYLLSCYLEWSRCVQIMSIQHQDTIHQPASSQTNRFWFICHSFQSDRDVRKVLKCHHPWFGDNTFRKKLTLTLHKTMQLYFTCEYITLTLHYIWSHI